MIEIQLLLLILVANGAPVLGANLFGQRGAWPADGGLVLPDGQRLLGPSKTWRGWVLAIGAAVAAAWVLGVALYVGLLIGLFAMLGDALSSFIKRRLGLKPSSMALGLDQIPEALLPLVAVRPVYALDWPTVLALTAAFFVLELVLSWIFFRLRLRSQPY